MKLEPVAIESTQSKHVQSTDLKKEHNFTGENKLSNGHSVPEFESNMTSEEQESRRMNNFSTEKQVLTSDLLDAPRIENIDNTECFQDSEHYLSGTAKYSQSAALVKKGIANNQALVLGCPVRKADETLLIPVGESVVLTTTRLELDKNRRTKEMARSKENVKERNGMSYCLVDIDDNNKSKEEIHWIMGSVDNNLKTCIKILNVSSSSYIYDSEGNELNGLKGLHIYLVVKNGKDIPRYLKVLSKRLWLAGHGHIMVDKAGRKHVRSLVDTSVGSPERMIFEASPTLTDGLIQNKPAPELIDGHLLDTEELLDLSDEEEQRYQKMVSEAKEKLGETSKAIFQSYSSEIKKIVKTQILKFKYL